MTKRIMDLLLVSLFLPLLIPLIVFLYIFLFIFSSSPIFYWSKRVGKNKKPYFMPKFRSMKLNTPELATKELHCAENFYIPFGEFLRKNSLDELPQFFSVLKGDMSLVGPRPASIKEISLIQKRDKYNINELLPGITGFAQINGRDKLDDDEKVKYDLEYLKKKSAWTDIKTLALTFSCLLRKTDIKH